MNGTKLSIIDARRFLSLRKPRRWKARATVEWCTERWRAMVPTFQPSTVKSRTISAAISGRITDASTTTAEV
jgi:hypothetical protein